jgi:hypothetical protein
LSPYRVAAPNAAGLRACCGQPDFAEPDLDRLPSAILGIQLGALR